MLIPDKEHLLLQSLHFSKQINLHVQNVLFERKSDFQHQGLTTNGDCLHTSSEAFQSCSVFNSVLQDAADSTRAPLFVLKGYGFRDQDVAGQQDSLLLNTHRTIIFIFSIC